MNHRQNKLRQIKRTKQKNNAHRKNQITKVFKFEENCGGACRRAGKSNSCSNDQENAAKHKTLDKNSPNVWRAICDKENRLK